MSWDPRTGAWIDDDSLQKEYQAQVDAGERDPLDLQQAKTIDNDSAGWEQILRNYAASIGLAYDPSDLAGVQRNYSYARNAGHDPLEFINNQLRIYDMRATNTPGDTSARPQPTPGGPRPPTPPPTPGGSPPGAPGGADPDDFPYPDGPPQRQPIPAPGAPNGRSPMGQPLPAPRQAVPGPSAPPRGPGMGGGGAPVAPSAYGQTQQVIVDPTTGVPTRQELDDDLELQRLLQSSNPYADRYANYRRALAPAQNALR